jgi:palmitoyltransferase ZDHHC13/17
MEIGVFILILLTLSFLDQLPAPIPAPACNILSPTLCSLLNKDPYTIVLVLWTSLQLVWVTMLLIVQLMQIARAQTTFESMRGHLHHSPHPPSAAEALTNFAVTGAPSASDAQIGPGNRGPDPVHPPHRKKEGCFTQWKRLLGVDVFVNTAIHGSNADTMMRRQRQNPFTRGMATNCSEFWCDGTGLLGYRTESGVARLGGERVDYMRLYEAPMMVYGGREGDGGGRYRGLAAEEVV